MDDKYKAAPKSTRLKIERRAVNAASKAHAFFATEAEMLPSNVQLWVYSWIDLQVFFGAALAMGTPAEWILGTLAATGASIDISQQCWCYSDECKYNEASSSCEMRPHPKSTLTTRISGCHTMGTNLHTTSPLERIVPSSLVWGKTLLRAGDSLTSQRVLEAFESTNQHDVVACANSLMTLSAPARLVCSLGIISCLLLYPGGTVQGKKGLNISTSLANKHGNVLL